MGAGKYNTLFVRQIGGTSQESTYGAVQLGYTQGESLWGYIEELRANEKLALGQVLSEAEVKIHLHNFPEIGAKDVLQDVEELYYVLGITYGDNETVCLAKRMGND